MSVERLSPEIHGSDIYRPGASLKREGSLSMHVKAELAREMRTNGYLNTVSPVDRITVNTVFPEEGESLSLRDAARRIAPILGRKQISRQAVHNRLDRIFRNYQENPEPVEQQEDSVKLPRMTQDMKRKLRSL